MTTIDRTLVRKQQSLNLYHYFEMFGKSVKVEVRVDFYSNQSCAKSYLLTKENGWKEIYSIEYPKMNAIKNNISYVLMLECSHAIEEDEKDIIEKTKYILKNI
jgi:hypothetical protein